MSKDIVPELLASIEKDFAVRAANSIEIKRISKLIAAGKATYFEANEYAIEIGRILAEAFETNLSSAALPDGKMYYNIAERILNKTLGNNHELISSATAKIQTELNEAASIGIKGIAPLKNQSRINGLIERVSAADLYDDVKWILDEPVINFSQSIVDDSVEANAAFHYKSGLGPTIVRKEMGNCCDWCREVVGTYSYPDVPKDVYRRHRYCRCTVDYHPGDGSKQNVHTKERQRESEQDRQERIARLSQEPEKFSNSSPARFSRAIADAKKMVPEENRWRVSACEPDEYVGSSLHVTDKGSTVAVDKDGDIISVCRRSDDTVRGSQLLEDAKKNGGIKLDSYAGNHNFYIKNGFEPISWCKWDDAHAPPDWQEGFAREPIIFYMYTGKTSSLSLVDFIDQVLPADDYYTAKDIRDGVIK